MKELTIEEKAKAYDDLLVKLQKAKVDNNVCDERYCCVIDDIVPELKEPEDERVRKEITELIMQPTWKTEKEFHRRKELCAWLEEQGEQKPVDKVEPKFKVGYWVTNSIETVQITGYDIDYGYQVDYKGNLQHRDTDIIEKEYHLWTIQDAKDGDVLCYETKNALGIFIYKIGHIHYHCCYYNGHLTTVDSFFVIQKHLRCYIHPATKEQRYLLFQKMKEAGYVWDEEKKELKNIEQNPVWSEEDEIALDDALWCCRQAASIAKDENDMGNAWYAENWLKSLKTRYTWKPSDEQMNALANALSLAKNCGEESAFDLRTLYEQLEKLKG